MTALPRMNLNQRVQHALLALGVGGALATGQMLGRPLASGASAAHAWHVAAGVAAFVLALYHVLYLAVRSYVEVRHWSGFPLRVSGADVAAARADVRHILGRAPFRPEDGEYRVSQKVLYWWTLAAVALLGATGLAMTYWARFGTLSLLPHLAALHRGLALALLASILWHLYGVLTWAGRWWPEWSWLSGVLDERKAELKFPGAWRRHLQMIEQNEKVAEASPEARELSRLTREKEEVQAELEKGNACALEERYADAVFHYRRALELYPGYSQARYNMARVLARMGETEMARETYTQFLETDPFHPLAQKAQEAVRELDAEDGRS